MADNLRPPPTAPRAEIATKITWVAHILRYLGGTFSHPRSDTLSENPILGVLPKRRDTDSESEGSDLDDDGAPDADTERAVTLSGSETHEQRCKSKFLDALAELLSPMKGWAYVTAASLQENQDNVTITVARNNGFAGNSDRGDGLKCQDLVGGLSSYLSIDEDDDNDTGASGTGALLPFEVAVIEYNGDRIEKWLDSVRRDLKGTHTAGRASGEGSLDGTESTRSQLEWDAFCSALLEGERDQGNDGSTLVLQAYSLCRLPHFDAFLLLRFGPERGGKLWRCVRLLARPLSNCRLLQSIAKKLPQFRHLRVRVLPGSQAVTALDSRSQVVDITTALEALVGVQFKQLNRSAVSKLLRDFGASFVKDCAGGRSFSQHAEIQLLQHHWSTVTWPAMSYLGCSKRTCLLCEEFLSALDPAISTRGRHGVCYPAWGLPQERSPSVSFALEALENSLISRIVGLLSQPTTRKATLHNVPQSTVVSIVSDMAANLGQLRLREAHRAEEELLRQTQEIM
jgi:hypothetical protein